ncbi:DNA repair-scaffolding protein-like [Sinocyclocheilus rhinocerous]|uniref:DNA repair-scaffolding protein-like n=1 Tax=Sinocyclocheilus rhinocerous TaxID=307959 RepID=UPI0007B84C35|nr:PREDICTED: DNA repair-scaffolding protein-like [Sinocyclocheilus rhinocerous]
MFGEVLLHCVSTESEIQQSFEQLEGCVCLLQALRVVQRLTRDKCSPLFSMTDSLWPPPVDPKSHDDLPQSPSDESSRCRCSFWATMVHKQLLSSNAGKREMLLFVTDPSLQMELNAEGNRRTVAVCLSPSCLIQSSVTQALETPQTQPLLMFRDAVRHMNTSTGKVWHN